MRRRFFSLFIAMCVVLSMLPMTVAAADTTGYWAAEALQAASDNGLLTGDAAGNLMPKNNLTRAQMAAIIVRAFGATDKASLSGFTDVKSGEWYETELSQAVRMKAMSGADGKIRPDDPITRQECFAVLYNVLKPEAADLSVLNKFKDADDITDWAMKSLAAMTAAGYINGSGGKINPKSYITRAEFAQVMHNVIKTYVRTSDISSVEDGNVMVNVPNIALSGLTVNGDLIIGDGVGNGDVTLDNVKVTGRVVVRGGGSNSIVLKNGSNVGSILVTKTADGGVRIRTEEGCNVDVVYIDDGKDDVVLEGTYNQVVVDTSTPIVLNNANVTGLTVKAQGANVDLAGSTTVSVVQINDTAVGAAIVVEKDAKVSTVNTAATGVIISGTGTIAVVNVSGNNTAVNVPGATVTAASGTTGVKQNGTEVAASSTTPTASPVPTTTPSPTSSPSPTKSPSTNSDPYPTPQPTSVTVYTAAGLKDALAVGYARINVYGNIESSDDLILGNGRTLAVPEGATLTLRGALTNFGMVDASGKIKLMNTFTNNQGKVFQSTGNIELYKGTIINHGTVNLSSIGENPALYSHMSGKIENKSGATFNLSGRSDVHNGFVLDNAGTFNLGPMTNVGGGDNGSISSLLITSGGSVNNGGTFVNNGKLELSISHTQEITDASSDPDALLRATYNGLGATFTNNGGTFSNYNADGFNITGGTFDLTGGVFNNEGALRVFEPYDMPTRDSRTWALTDTRVSQACTLTGISASTLRNDSGWIEYYAEAFSSNGFYSAKAAQQAKKSDPNKIYKFEEYTHLHILFDFVLNQNTDFTGFREIWVKYNWIEDTTAKVTVGNGVTLTVDNGTNLIAADRGIIENNGTIHTKSADYPNGIMEGLVEIWPNGAFTNNGTINNEGRFYIWYDDMRDGTLGRYEGADVSGSIPDSVKFSAFVYTADGLIAANGTVPGRSPKVFSFIRIRWNSNIELGSDITITNKDMHIEPGSGLIIPSGKTLTYNVNDTDHWIDNGGDISIYGNMITSASSPYHLDINNNQKIEIGSLSGGGSGVLRIGADSSLKGNGILNIYATGTLDVEEQAKCDFHDKASVKNYGAINIKQNARLNVFGDPGTRTGGRLTNVGTITTDAAVGEGNMPGTVHSNMYSTFIANEGAIINNGLLEIFGFYKPDGTMDTNISGVTGSGTVKFEVAVINEAGLSAASANAMVERIFVDESFSLGGTDTLTITDKFVHVQNGKTLTIPSGKAVAFMSTTGKHNITTWRDADGYGSIVVDGTLDLSNTANEAEDKWSMMMIDGTLIVGTSGTVNVGPYTILIAGEKSGVVTNNGMLNVNGVLDVNGGDIINNASAAIAVGERGRISVNDGSFVNDGAISTAGGMNTPEGLIGISTLGAFTNSNNGNIANNGRITIWYDELDDRTISRTGLIVLDGNISKAPVREVNVKTDDGLLAAFQHQQIDQINIRRIDGAENRRQLNLTSGTALTVNKSIDIDDLSGLTIGANISLNLAENSALDSRLLNFGTVYIYGEVTTSGNYKIFNNGAGSITVDAGLLDVRSTGQIMGDNVAGHPIIYNGGIFYDSSNAP